MAEKAWSGWSKVSKPLSFVLGVILVLTFIVATVGAVRATSGSSTTFILGTSEDELITNLNPLTNTGLGGDISGIIYSTTLAYEFTNGTVIPWLAQNWSITNGGKTITFNLVSNAYWMNGTSKSSQITSQDVVYTFQAIMANKTLDKNNIDPYIANITAPSKYTVQFELKRPSNVIFYYLAGQIIIPHAWSTYESNVSNIGNYYNMNIGHELSSGPMILKSVSGSVITLVANPYFFKGAPHFSTEVIELFKSSSSMISALQTGQIDATYVTPRSLYTALKSMPGIKPVAYKDTFTLALWYDDNVAPFNNTNFRIGLDHAINKTKILNVAEDGAGGRASTGGLPWTLSAFYNKTLPYYAYNVTAANQYFVKAGLHISSNGFWAYPNGTTVQIRLVEGPIADWDVAASTIQQELSADHFSVVYSIVPLQVWLSETLLSPSFNFASYFNFGPLFGNAWYALHAAFSYGGLWNFEHFNNQTVNLLLNQSSVYPPDSYALNTTLNKVQGIISQQLPFIPLVGADVLFAYRPSAISGFYPNVQTISPLDSLYAHPVSSKSGTSSSPSALIYEGIGITVIVALIAVAVVVHSRKKSRKK